MNVNTAKLLTLGHRNAYLKHSLDEL